MRTLRVRDMAGHCVLVGQDESPELLSVLAGAGLEYFSHWESGFDEICPIWGCSSRRDARGLIDTHVEQGRPSMRGVSGVALDGWFGLWRSVAHNSSSLNHWFLNKHVRPRLLLSEQEKTQKFSSTSTSTAGGCKDEVQQISISLRRDVENETNVKTGPRKDQVDEEAGDLEQTAVTVTEKAQRLLENPLGFVVLDYVDQEVCGALVQLNYVHLISASERKPLHAESSLIPLPGSKEYFVLQGDEAAAARGDVLPSWCRRRRTSLVGAKSLPGKEEPTVSIFRVGPSYGRTEKTVLLNPVTIPFFAMFFDEYGLKPGAHREAELLGRQFKVAPYKSEHPKEQFACAFAGIVWHQDSDSTVSAPNQATVSAPNQTTSSTTSRALASDTTTRPRLRGASFRIWRIDKQDAGWGSDLWLQILP
ncbi:unnamed protein product [Amoebophrya sp. A25]|nr:unnamed protein product [Amoebophrya sp. A25]|eukprot:GSA25T00010487001.1